MKARRFKIAVIILFMSGVVMCILSQNQKDYSMSDLVLKNIEALSVNENNGDKKYKYVTFPEEICYIYVGQAYAKGKKVTCWSGNEHPICVNCML